MSDNRDDKLEQMLRSRRLEPASPDLTQRIILKAQAMPQNKNLPLWQWIRQVCAEFHLPKPAYVLAGALIFGVVIGFNTPPDISPAIDDSVQNFLSADEALL
jgi:hypothetical protein